MRILPKTETAQILKSWAVGNRNLVTKSLAHPQSQLQRQHAQWQQQQSRLWSEFSIDWLFQLRLIYHAVGSGPVLSITKLLNLAFRRTLTPETRPSTARPRDVHCSALEQRHGHDLQSFAQPNLAIMDEDFTIDRSESFPQEVLALRGPLTAINAPIFQNAMRREEPADTIILDLSDVPYVDSAGLGSAGQCVCFTTKGRKKNHTRAELIRGCRSCLRSRACRICS